MSVGVTTDQKQKNQNRKAKYPYQVEF